MSGVVASEGEINSIVKEYLVYNGFVKSVQMFDAECAEKGKPVALLETRPKTSRGLANIQQELLAMFDNGHGQEFFELWMKNVNQDRPETISLEFWLNIYFIVCSHQMRFADTGDNVLRFRKYLELRGGHLRSKEQQQYVFMAYNTDPNQIPEELLADSWSESIRKRLVSFIRSSLSSASAAQPPRLIQLFSGAAVPKDMLQKQLLEYEKTSDYYRKQYAITLERLINAIGLAENVITRAGSCVDISDLFELTNNIYPSEVLQTQDFSRPGTAARVLRESMSLMKRSTNLSNLGNNSELVLNYEKIKMDLVTLPIRPRALLLQALRQQKLLKVSHPERIITISDYKKNDLLGYMTSGPLKQTVIDMLNDEDGLLREAIVRLINCIAFTVEGRGYLILCEDLIHDMCKSLKQSGRDFLPATEHMVCSLYMLSLRSKIREKLLKEGMLEWLITSLRRHEEMSDFTLDYAVSLLFNLTRKKLGLKKCIKLVDPLLNIIIHLFDYDNKSMKQFVLGILYNVLLMSSIRIKAQATVIKEIIADMLPDADTKEEKNRIQAVLGRLQSTGADDKKLDDDGLEDDDVDDDDDDDDDNVPEKEEDFDDMIFFDQTDSLKPTNGELSGDQLLAKYYTAIRNPGNQKHRQPYDDFMTIRENMPPRTPGQVRSSTNSSYSSMRNVSSSYSDMRNVSPVRVAPSLSAIPGSRPSTSSGRRQKSSDDINPSETQKTVEKQRTLGSRDPFAASSKIPRTPDPVNFPANRESDSLSRLQPTFSDSLPRAGSDGRLSRLSSQSRSQLTSK